MRRLSVEGVVHSIGEVKTFGKNFQKRDLVLRQEQGRWDNFVPLVLTREDVREADSLALGDEIIAEFEVKGREWEPKDGGETRYFCDLQVIGLSVVGQSPDQPQPQPSTAEEAPF